MGIVTCASCRENKTHKARGLCGKCYCRHQYLGTLIDFERTSHARSELLADWAILEADGYSRRDAAARLGVTKKCLEKAIARNRQATEAVPA